jgi:hypothetical protein
MKIEITENLFNALLQESESFRKHTFKILCSENKNNLIKDLRHFIQKNYNEGSKISGIKYIRQYACDYNIEELKSLAESKAFFETIWVPSQY